MKKDTTLVLFTPMTLDEFYSQANKGYYDDYVDHFQKDAEAAFEFSHLPDDIKSKIHGFAYEKGHSSGYSEISLQYDSVVDIAKAAFEAGKKS